MQKGFIFLPVLFILALVALTGSIYYVQKTQKENPNLTSEEKNDSQERHFSLDLLPIPGKATPTPSLSTKNNTKTIPTTSPATEKKSVASSPTAPSTQTALKSICSINVLPLSDNASGATFTYAVSSLRGTYMTGAQWDFDNNGSWDTDLSQTNGRINHVYGGNGSYTVKLQLKMSDGEITDTCSKSFSLPMGTSIKWTGHVYEDINCNDMMEPDEKGIAGVHIDMFLLPDYSIYATLTSDSNGYYELSRIIGANDSLTLKANDWNAPDHLINASRHPFTLNSFQSSVNQDLPQVPIANSNLCGPAQ